MTGFQACPQRPARWRAPELTLRQAADLKRVTVKTLSLRPRCGQLAGYELRGASGREWRVTMNAMDVAGYARRDEDAGDHGEEFVRLRQEVTIPRRAAAADRRRADDLDRRLGHALLECGRLRSALAAETGEQPPTEPELDAGTARWLISAVTGGSTFERTGAVPSQDQSAVL